MIYPRSIIPVIAFAAAAFTALPATAHTIVLLEQDRYTSALVQSKCEGETSEMQSAEAFELFDSQVYTIQECPEIPVFGSALASQLSSFDDSSMDLFMHAQYGVQTPGSIFASAVSNFSVTFELPHTSVLTAEGLLLGGGQVPGVESLLELTGPDGLVFSLALTGPFPFGEPTIDDIDEQHTLQPGVYELQARATCADAIDIAEDFIFAEAALNVQINIDVPPDRCPFDLNDNGIVGPEDLALLLGHWGPVDCAGHGCPDFNQDGQVNADDLAVLLGHWGACP